MTKPVILHISGDYPDIMQPAKTKAVLNLVEGTPEYRHVVYSLNRVNGIGGISSMSFGKDRTAVAYGALPKGVLWERRLPQIAHWIAADLKAKNITPDLIEAHKFTIEGVIGHELLKTYNCPLICDIQGYTDINILRKKRSLRERYKEIAKISAAILPYAPWPIKAFEELVNLDADKCTCLPVVPYVDKMMAAPVIEEHKLLSVFHLDGWQNKNFEGVALAVKKLRERYSGLTLDVYGGGSAKTILALQKIIDGNDIGAYVRLMGPVENGKMPELMQQYVGFVMPSKSESYGLVYIEALFSGVPILFNANRGISGYFDEKDIGYGCDPHSIDDISAGMAHLIDNQAYLKKNIAKMQKEGAFDMCRGGNIIKTYKNVIDGVLSDKKI